MDDVTAAAPRKASCARFLSLFDELAACPDQAERLMCAAATGSSAQQRRHVLAPTGADALQRGHFAPLLDFVVHRHPGMCSGRRKLLSPAGLAFLAQSPMFQTHYQTTVIERIFFSLNRSCAVPRAAGSLDQVLERRHLPGRAAQRLPDRGAQLH